MQELYQGRPVERFVLTNHNHTRVVILALGGIIQEFSLIDHGQRQNLIVNFDKISDYIKNPYQICKQIGRIAGRIKDASFELSGQTVHVPANEGHNTLHGGDHGIATKLFNGYQTANNEVMLYLTLDTRQDHFPGSLTLMVDYLLTDDDKLTINYDVTAQKDTVFDPTVHIYWQLPQNLKNTTLKINGDQLQLTDKEKIPTGKLKNVKSSAFDFTTARKLDEAVTMLRSKNQQQGFDNGYAVHGSLTTPVAEIDKKNKHLKVKIFSDRNGLVIFTADPQNSANDSKGIFNALATEVQTLPDALHHPEFGEVRLLKGTHKHITMAFQVTKYQ